MPLSILTSIYCVTFSDEKKQPVANKKINKIQTNKLEEKEINTANIIV